MSLREEISRAIHTCIANPNQRVNSDKAANATIAVLSIFEKRIDVLFQQLKQKDIDSKTRGYLDCLDDVKELVK